jgi:type II secretory pathway component GspD/PulD (secretin)
VDASGRTTATGLPPMVSIALEEVPVQDVFRAIGAAINVPVVIEGHIERPPVTVKFTNSQTTAVLDHLCKNAGCTWEFDSAARQLRVRFKAP